MIRPRSVRHIRLQPWTWFVLIVMLVLLVAMLTYLAGGTKSPVPHAFYIPVVLAAGAFGLRAGLIVAVLAGLVCGPLMPLDVEAGVAQATYGWLVRLAFFITIAAVVGVGRTRLLALRRARQDFLATVSHELRTPLTSVIGFATVLSDSAGRLTDEERRQFAGLILDEATELANVVDHYVIEGRLDDSALFIDARPTELRQVIEIVLEGMPGTARQRRVRIVGEPVVCRADPLRLRQILRSILNNALAYSSSRIAVRLQASGAYAEVVVTDGPPKRQTLLSRISTWPQSPTSSGVRVAAPLGIGLAVSRDLARRMGGDLEYEVKGATNVRLRLPLETSSRR